MAVTHLSKYGQCYLRTTMSAKSLKWITPTFQQVLNKQLAKIMDALDAGDLELAFIALHTLVCSLKPSDRSNLLQNYIFPIKRRLEEAGNHRFDFYVAGIGVTKQQAAILRANIRPIFTAVMHTLHSGGYLEVHRAQAPTNVDPTRLIAQLPP